MTWLDFILYRKLGSWRLELNPVNSFTISHLLWRTILTPGFLESGGLLQAITYAKLHGCWLLSQYFLMQKQCQFSYTSWSWNCHWTCSLKSFLYGINESGSQRQYKRMQYAHSFVLSQSWKRTLGFFLKRKGDLMKSQLVRSVSVCLLTVCAPSSASTVFTFFMWFSLISETFFFTRFMSLANYILSFVFESY